MMMMPMRQDKDKAARTMDLTTATRYTMVVCVAALAIGAEASVIPTGLADLPCLDTTNPICIDIYDNPLGWVMDIKPEYSAEYFTCKRSQANVSSTIYGKEVCVLDLNSGSVTGAPIFSSLMCVAEPYAECLGDFSVQIGVIPSLAYPEVAAAYNEQCGGLYNPNAIMDAGKAMGKLINASMSYPEFAGLVTYAASINLEYHCGDHAVSADTGFITVLLVISFILVLAGISELIIYLVSTKKTDGNSINGEEKPLVANTTERPKRKKEKFSLRVFVQLFNPTKNLGILLAKSPARSLGGLDGLRSLSMFWIIMVHSDLLSTFIGNEDPDATIEFLTSTGDQLVIGAEYAVDTFFFISGMLTAYSLTKKFRHKMRPAIKAVPQGLFFTLFRFLRLTPVYAFIMMVYTFIFPKLASGPFWYKMHIDTDRCRNYWWTNILYINNFYPPVFADQCMSWSWYLANDMQFFLVALVLLNIYVRFPKLGGPLMFLLAIASNVAGYLVMKDNMPGFQDIFYDKPYFRISPLLFGMLIGCALRDTSLAKMKLKRLTSSLLLATAIAMIMFILFINHTRYKDYGNPLYAKEMWTESQDAAFVTFGRLLFIWGLTIISVLCVTDNGGFVGKFLSQSWWEPFGKLTYGAYLIHPAIIRVLYFSQVNFVYEVNIWNQMVNFLGIMFLSYIFSLFTFTMIEIPFEGLFKKLLM